MVCEFYQTHHYTFLPGHRWLVVCFAHMPSLGQGPTHSRPQLPLPCILHSIPLTNFMFQHSAASDSDSIVSTPYLTVQTAKGGCFCIAPQLYYGLRAFTKHSTTPSCMATGGWWSASLTCRLLGRGLHIHDHNFHYHTLIPAVCHGWLPFAMRLCFPLFARDT